MSNNTAITLQMIQSLIIGVLIAIVGFIATDIYTPSLPAIAHYFNVSFDVSQLSISVFMFGSAICQLVYGPISEAYGRKMPLLIGLCLMCIGSIICSLAINIEMLIFGRIIQGIGAGSTMLFRAVLRDSLQGKQLSVIGGYFGIICVLVVPSAPMIGGYLEEIFNWRASFIFMSVLIMIIFIAAIFCFKETHKSPNKDHIKYNSIINNYIELLTSKLFMGYTLCICITFGALFSWITASPILLIHLVGMNPSDFGMLAFVVSAIPMSCSTILNSQLVKFLGSNFMLKLGWGLIFVSGIMMLIGYIIFGTTLYAIIIPIIVFFIGSTLIWPNGFAVAFTPFGHIAGYAGSLYGFMQVIGGAIFSALISHLPENNQLPLAAILILCPTTCYLILRFVIKSD